MNIYEIGQTVFYAHAGPQETWITCPECCGQRYLKVTLGNGETVTIECTCCERGYEGSPGRIQSYEYRADVQEVKICGLESRLKGDKLITRYQFNGCYLADEGDLFPTREQADSRAIQLVHEHEEEEKNRIKRKEKDTRKWSWNVSYHRRCIARAQHDIEYHTAKLNAAPKSREAQRT